MRVCARRYYEREGRSNRYLQKARIGKERRVSWKVGCGIVQEGNTDEREGWKDGCRRRGYDLRGRVRNRAKGLVGAKGRVKKWLSKQNRVKTEE